MIETISFFQSTVVILSALNFIVRETTKTITTISKTTEIIVIILTKLNTTAIAKK